MHLGIHSDGSPASHQGLIWLAVLGGLFLICISFPAGFLTIPMRHYLPLHTALEFFSVAVSLMVFALIWNAARIHPTGNPLFLAVAFLAIAVIDFGHAMSYPGMSEFFGENSADKAILFWLAARLTLTASFVVIAWRPQCLSNWSLSRRLCMAAAFLWTSGVYWLILLRPLWLPASFIEGQGLTDFKIGMEYLFVVLLSASAFVLWRRNVFGHFQFRTLACAAATMVMSELFFTLYASINDFFNLLGHVYKVITYAIVYRVVFVAGVHEPYLLSMQSQRALAQSNDELERRVRERTAELTAQVRAREQAERAIHNSHSLLESVFENPHVLIAVLDTDMNFVRVNHAYAEAGRKTIDYFTGKNHFVLYPHAENERIFRNAAVTGVGVKHSAKPFEYANNPERGVTHWDWTLTPLRDAGGEISAVVLMLLDVTERIRILETLSEQERELRAVNESLEKRVAKRTADLLQARDFTEAVVNTIDALVLVLDRQGCIVRFNGACEMVSGYSGAEVMGRFLWDYLLFPEGVAEQQQMYSRIDTLGFPMEYEQHWHTKKGERRLIAWSNTCIRENGAVTYVIATGVDITERKKAEQAARENEARFRLIADHIRDVIWLNSPDRSRLEYISPSCERIWGLTRETLYANPKLLLDCIHPDDAAQLLALYAAQREEGLVADQYLSEYRIVRPDGSIRNISDRYWPIRNEQREIYLIGGVAEDITERKRAEVERLERERRQRDTLVREVHHRIKNNLQGVVGLLRQQATQRPALRETMNTAIAQVTTMALVHGLQGHNREECIKPQDLCKAIAKSIEGLMRITMAVEYVASVHNRVYLSSSQAVPVALILNELMFNAVKHRNKDSNELSVRIALDADQCVIRICNAGSTPQAGFHLPYDGPRMGLNLVRALTPPGALFQIQCEKGWVTAELRLAQPVITIHDA